MFGADPEATSMHFTVYHRPTLADLPQPHRTRGGLLLTGIQLAPHMEPFIHGIGLVVQSLGDVLQGWERRSCITLLLMHMHHTANLTIRQQLQEGEGIELAIRNQEGMGTLHHGLGILGEGSGFAMLGWMGLTSEGEKRIA